jgi:PKD domain-containing protein
MTALRARIAVCAATVLASCTHSPQSPTTPSSPSSELGGPPLSVLVDGQRGATAIVHVSDVNVDATVPGNTKLRYQVDYGDGQSSTQPVSKHVYADAGTFHLTVTMTDAVGRKSSVSQDVSVGVVNGAWFQFGVNEAIHRFEARRLSINQDGTQILGTYVAYGEPDRRITGQLTANRQITLTTDDGAVKFDGVLPFSLSDAGYPVTLTPLGGTVGLPLRFDPVPRDPPPSPPNAELRVQNGIPGRNYSNVLYAGFESTFDATQSTGDGISYVIDFGDSTFANAGVAEHVLLPTLGFGEQLSARAFVVDRFGRVDSETVSFFLFRITCGVYCYISDFQNPATGRRERRVLRLPQQSGTQITGTYEHPEGWTSPLTATLSGANHIHLRLDDGTIDMDGTVTRQRPPSAPDFGGSPTWLVLTVRGGSADGVELPFSLYDPF